MSNPESRIPNLQSRIPIFLILLFHISGFIGMCFTSHTQWFLDNTPLNLMIAFVGIFISIPNKTLNFYKISLFVAVFGWLVEYIGITTFLPFGKYDYRDSIMGVQLLGVPLMLGVNWWLQVYGYGTIAHIGFATLVAKKDKETVAHIGVATLVATKDKETVEHIGVATLVATKKTELLLKSLFAAFLMVVSDIPMEILANKIGLWYWHEGFAPIQNYAGWFFYGFCLQFLCNYYKIFEQEFEQNPVAIVYCIVTTLFFWGLVVFL